jgi:hypothetical protein
MESSLFLSDLLTGHEPEMPKTLEIKRGIFRFMERLMTRVGDSHSLIVLPPFPCQILKFL